MSSQPEGTTYNTYRRLYQDETEIIDRDFMIGGRESGARVTKDNLEKMGLDPDLLYIGTFVNQKNQAKL